MTMIRQMNLFFLQLIEKEGKPVAVVSDKDSVVFFNFRPDRAREITRAFCDDDFKGFERETRPHVHFCMLYRL